MVPVRLAVCGLAIGTPAVLGQWSADPAANLTLADRTGEQVQPKLVPTPDGGCFVSWFDNSSGGYDVYLQRLDAGGFEQWAHNGLLIADRAVSSTVDYDLTIDLAGNALLAYNDDGGVAGAAQQIAVQKVSPAGAKLWGPSGVTISAGPDFKANPRIAVLTDGNVIVGYSNSPSGSAQVWIMQKLDAVGGPLWTASGVTIGEASHYLALSDLKPDASGGAIALWVRGTTASPTTSAKALYSQKYDGAGTAVWNGGSPVIVFNTTSIQNGYFPKMLADGAGGAVYGWYEIGGSRNAYIQHVLAGGALKFAAPVANTGVTPGRIRIGAGLGYNAATGDYFLASEESASPSQGDYSVIAQKFDSTGARLWADAGALVLLTGTGNQPSFVQCQPTGTGCLVFGIDSRTATTGVVFSARVNGDASMPWSNLASSTINTKSRLTSCLGTQGFAILAWGNGPFGSADIQAQNVNLDGTFGPSPQACYANCDNSTTPPILTVADFGCFLNAFAAGLPSANCDGSTTPPVLTVADFGCFLNRFAAGCS